MAKRRTVKHAISKAYNVARRHLCVEALEPRQLLAGDLQITEFMASNRNTLLDGDGNSSDWIELFNAGDAAVALDGWHLTDDQNDLPKWSFPDLQLAAGEFLTVFASGQDSDDYVDASGHLHTNFSLDAGGEYLALVDGTTVEQEFTPDFGDQVEDVSFGLEMETSVLVGDETPLEYLVPTDDTLEPAWRLTGFTHSNLVTGEVSASSSTMVITEAGTGTTDFVELQNVSGTVIDTSGWVVAVNNAESPTVTDYSTIVSNEADVVSYWRLNEDVQSQAEGVDFGQQVLNRSSQDSFHGSAIYNTPITDPGTGGLGRVVAWSFFNDNAAAVGRQATPLLVERVGGSYVVRGVGTTRTVDGSGVQNHAFDIIDGTDTFDWSLGTYHMGIRYGSPTVSNPGVVEFANGANSWAFYGSSGSVSGTHNIVLGSAVTGPQTFASLGREYSLQFRVESASGGGGDPITAVDTRGTNDGQYSTTGLVGSQTGAIVSDSDRSVDFRDGALTVPDDVSLHAGGTSWTVEAWVQPDGTGSFQAIVAKESGNANVTPGLDYLLGIEASGQFSFASQGIDNRVVAPSASLFDGSVWYHVAGVQDPGTSTIRLYVNGQLQGSAPMTTTGVTAAADLVIGDRSDGEQKLDGRIDEVAIYRRALSGEDVQLHYLAGIGALTGGVDRASAVVWELLGSVGPDEVIYKTDHPSDQYWGSDIAWDANGSGWVLILDDEGSIADFAAWGYSAAELDGLTVSVRGQSVTIDDEWLGGGVTANGADGITLQRTGTEDDDDGGNFQWLPESKGTVNDGLIVPFEIATEPNFNPIGYSQDTGGEGARLGPEVVARTTVDGASGSIFVLDNYPFTGTDRVTQWSFYATNTLTVTPILFQRFGNTFEITGVGQPRTSDGSGLQTYDFGLQAGTDQVDEDSFFGFKDGDNNANNAGVIQWDDQTADTIRWFGGEQNGNVVDGQTFNGGQTFPRTYSVQAITTPTLRTDINTDVSGAMFEQSSSLYVRYPFAVDGNQSVDSMALRIAYDDGFVAYLNGSEIARRNVAAVTSYDSTATDDRMTDGVDDFEDINVSEFANLLVNGNNVLAIHGFNEAVDSPEFFINAQLVTAKVAAPVQIGYFETPTPGFANLASLAGFVGDTTFSIDRGFYANPIDVDITTLQTPDAVIYYTTNGSDPGPENVSAQVFSGPITIDRTTTLRAAGFKAGFRPTNIDTHTYVFVDDVVNQGVMSAAITGNATWGPQMVDSLLALPTVSLVTPNSISQVEQSTSIEMIYPDGSNENFQVEGGVEHFGGHSINYPKKSMRLSFKAIYGPTRLRHDVYQDGGVDEFDQILLRAGSHDTPFYRHGNGTRGFYTRGRWSFERQLEMGHPAPRGRFVHVYINGTYWGMHNLMERPNADFMASNFGGEKEDYDALNAGSPIDGDAQAWNTMASVANDYDALTQYLDVENYVDYMLFQFYVGNDWDWNHSQNWGAARKREEGAGFKFFNWDSDMVLRTSVNANVINRGGPGNLWGAIGQHPEVRNMMRDRAQELFFNDGMFTPDRVLADFEALADEIRLSVIAETARWGGSAYTPDTWQAEQDRIFTEIIAGRTDVVIQQLRDNNLLPPVAAPEFSINGQPQHGGRIVPDDLLTMTVPPLDGPILSETDLVTASQTVSAIVPQNAVLDTAWRAPNYVEGTNGETWTSGTNGVGYENSSGYQSAIHIDVGAEMFNGNTSVYVRMPFTVADQATIDSFDALTLKMLYDDGFVAYLNGVQITQQNAPASPQFNSTATTASPEANLNSPVQFDVSAFLGELNVGTNVLAIHGMNVSANSSDLLIRAELAGGEIVDEPTMGDIFFTIDGSDPMELGATLFTTPVPLAISTEVKARTLFNGDWSALSQATFVVVPESGGVVISEINYNPAEPTPTERFVFPDLDNNAFEFLELFNANPTDTINLVGMSLTDGVEFTFGNVILAPGERTVIVRDNSAFQLRYGLAVSVAGQWSDGLSNGGERITLVDALDNVVLDFEYSDGDPWPERADGAGGTLELIDPEIALSHQFGKYYRWRGSTEFGGTPGTAGIGPIGVVINEVLAHTDPPATASDSIELLNTTAAPFDIGGWYLSDSSNELLKYEIPADTILAAGEFIVFDESHFNPTPLMPGPKDFALSGATGDDVWLVIPDVSGRVLSFVDDVHFGATFNGQALGVTANSNGRLAPLTRNTLGCQNSQPLVDDSYIATINYLPADPTAAALAIEPNLDNNDLEYLIVRGEVSEGWRIRGGIQFDFPAGFWPTPTAWIISFDPDDPANANKLAAFREHYGLVANSGPYLIGGYSGSLSNTGEQLRLERPDAPPPDDPTAIPYVTVDEVIYDDLGDWPTLIAGDPITRRASMFFGNDGNLWAHQSDFPLLDNVTGDYNGDKVVDAFDIDLLIDAVNRDSHNGDFVLSGTFPTPEVFEIEYFVEDFIGTFFGDANLDRQVDGVDLGIWVDHRFQSCTGWAAADFNGDGVTDGSDFNVWSQNKFNAAAAEVHGLMMRPEYRVRLCDNPNCHCPRPWSMRSCRTLGH